MHVQQFNLGPSKKVFLGQSIKHDDAPPIKNVVRMDMFQAIVLEKVGSDVKTTTFFSFDLKGYFPAMLTNIMLAD